MSILRAILVLCIASSSGCTCTSSPTAPTRPAGVPADAFWNGGLDGGVFVRVRQKARKPRPVYDVTIYNEYTGEVWFQGPMTLSAPGELEARVLGDAAFFNGWDGERLFLRDGRFLAPL
ncbi:hypothetical protein [Archangium primigenium]|uniref:hypothetical protein n=1 Tax=[Archangium] primigenium TaxID=2792470 RepID=UPI00195977C4|nr:hypothetical protein [Archangium primigenium]MBM7114200.1 hypothetical protein [Archangium primigenium]